MIPICRILHYRCWRVHEIIQTTIYVFAAIMMGCWLGGCASQMGHQQMEKVAKDWCYAVRASQVMPVYPLTEDLRPGDVYVVQTTLQDQARIWNDRGFLPLDDQRTRLGGIDYTKMYFDAYWKDEFGGHHAPHPRPVLTNAGSLALPDPAAPSTMARASLGVEAPRAAFPSYSFEADASTGFALAVPVHGIPVGLNFMNASKAVGSLTIADAYTYAADPEELYDKLQQWAGKDNVQVMLQAAYAQVQHVIYLRVVTRVYLAGAVSVSLTNADQNAGNIKVGADVDVPLISNGKLNSDYDALLTALDNQAKKAFPVNAAGNMIPGGAIKFAFASRRAVALSEAFDTPLAIGFLGFDVPVDPQGNIGFPIPTFQILRGDVVATAPRMDTLTWGESQVNIRLAALDGLASQPGGLVKVARIVEKASDRIDSGVFADPAQKAHAALQLNSSDPGFNQALADAKNAFEHALRWDYLPKGGGTGTRYDRFLSIFDKVFIACTKE